MRYKRTPKDVCGEANTGAPRSKLIPVPSHGSIFVYMIPPQNVMAARVTAAWVHTGSCNGARISLQP